MVVHGGMKIRVVDIGSGEQLKNVEKSGKGVLFWKGKMVS